jgi:hypothetical protein
MSLRRLLPMTCRPEASLLLTGLFPIFARNYIALSSFVTRTALDVSGILPWACSYHQLYIRAWVAYATSSINGLRLLTRF